jgi:hypothetical protein
VYFVSQNPLDIPDVILGQLGNRVQHALRAFTPRDQKAVKAAAETFRSNPDIDVETAITELAVGEALVSFLDEKGTPQPVQRALIKPPHSRIGPASDEERKQAIQNSVIYGHYEKQVDRESAYEILKGRAEQTAPEPKPTAAQPQSGGNDFGLADILNAKVSWNQLLKALLAASVRKWVGKSSAACWDRYWVVGADAKYKRFCTVIVNEMGA